MHGFPQHLLAQDLVLTKSPNHQTEIPGVENSGFQPSFHRGLTSSKGIKDPKEEKGETSFQQE